MIDEPTIRRYAEKIYGFAYSKTGRTADAEDLAQEILLNLCTVDFATVAAPDAFVYTVCRYTWSKFLRKNKPAWDAVIVSGEFPETDSVSLTEFDTPEETIVRAETYERLRREIVCLSETRRNILILYYYDRLDSAKIGEKLGLSPSTVRGHLSKIRRDLKERITMTDEIYRPTKLQIGHHGYWNSEVYRSLESDILMQNICYICREKPLSVEEISRTLGVAAVYLEDKLERLCSMDYMVTQSGKYRTNFFIRDVPFNLAHIRYQMEHVPFVAEEYHRALTSVFNDVRNIGFVGHDLPETDLLWDVYAYFLMREISRTDDRMIAELHLNHGAPMRPDGSKHWVRAGVSREEMNASPELTDEMREFLEKTCATGLKSSSNFDGTVRSYQFDMSLLGVFRTFDSYYVSALEKAAELERRGERVAEIDREQFAMLTQNGYVTVTDGSVRLNVPYFTKEERAKLDEILDRAAETMDREAIYAKFTGYAREIDRYIPDYISANERAHYRTSFDPHVEVLWYLVETGRLEKPKQSGANCTIVYEVE